jgi:nitroimidazol reductase NimA-like FMN-containing flavoprotein (pyridoxamine 5'-phosphate oxidase superfamily)
MSTGDPRVARFLATREVVILATLQPDGAPLALPMWFVHDGAVVTMLSVDGMRKVRNLRRDDRACVVAEAGTRADIRGVVLQGRARFLGDTPERAALLERFHAKYDPDLARRWGGRAMPADRVMFQVVPDRVLTWGLL